MPCGLFAGIREVIQAIIGCDLGGGLGGRWPWARFRRAWIVTTAISFRCRQPNRPFARRGRGGSCNRPAFRALAAWLARPLRW